MGKWGGGGCLPWSGVSKGFGEGGGAAWSSPSAVGGGSVPGSFPARGEVAPVTWGVSVPRV